jgi:hypothetical protein
MTLAAGTHLGPYEIAAQLGAGGMGEVYRARDTRLGRDVAVKVLPGGVSDDAEALGRFELEARAVAALNHPNILALHDVGTQNGIAYAVTELLEGETLRARIDSAGPMAPRKALDYALQIARGLAAAHERGIVHRDMKPENVFITRDGRIKILDFGLAGQDVARDTGANEVTRSSTGPDIIMGTVGYMAPEQILAQPATSRSDIFALGVVLYEMLTATHPFKHESPIETQTAVLRDDPPPISRALPGLPSGVVRLLARCLEKQPADRPESTRDLAFYLEMLGAATESGAFTTTGDALAAGLRRLRTRSLLVSCGLVLLISAAAMGYVRSLANRAATDAIAADLARAGRLVARVQDERLTRLSLTARLIASFPELKALLETDMATVRDFLLAYQQRNPGTPLLVALGPTGRVIARTDEAQLGTTVGDEWLRGITATKGPTIVMVGDRPFHVAGAAAEAGGNIFGYVFAAAPVDVQFATALSEATQDDVVLLSTSGLLASTMRAGQTPWRSLQAWRDQGGRTDRSTYVRIGTQQFAARQVTLVENPPLVAVIVKSRDEAVVSYRRIERGLIVLALAAAAAAIFGSYRLPRAITSALSAPRRRVS